jgi:hypothetical protein
MHHAPEIAIAVAGLPARGGAPWGMPTPDAAAWIRDQRVRGLALDAARPDCRARDLGRSARRDLAAMLRRTELELAGIDLFIPPEHYTDAAKSERAMQTVEQTAILAAELARLVGGRSRPVISITLPASLPEHDRAALTAVFEQHGAIGADHTPDAPHPSAWLGAGIDPAACFLAATDPATLAAQPGVVALRLSNLNATGRCPVNAEGGRLDLPTYTGALLTRHLHWITADTRGCAEPARAVRAALDAWRGLTALPGDPI